MPEVQAVFCFNAARTFQRQFAEPMNIGIGHRDSTRMQQADDASLPGALEEPVVSSKKNSLPPGEMAMVSSTVRKIARWQVSSMMTARWLCQPTLEDAYDNSR